VWHCSIMTTTHPILTPAALACEVLEGIGDARAEWVEPTNRAYHVRRRLTVDEARRVPAVEDIRGTLEAAARVRALAAVRPALADWARQEARL
jgi:hypothetical protein